MASGTGTWGAFCHCTPPCVSYSTTVPHALRSVPAFSLLLKGLPLVFLPDGGLQSYLGQWNPLKNKPPTPILQAHKQRSPSLRFPRPRIGGTQLLKNLRWHQLWPLAEAADCQLPSQDPFSFFLSNSILSRMGVKPGETPQLPACLAPSKVSPVTKVWPVICRRKHYMRFPGRLLKTKLCLFSPSSLSPSRSL